MSNPTQVQQQEKLMREALTHLMYADAAKMLYSEATDLDGSTFYKEKIAIAQEKYAHTMAQLHANLNELVDVQISAIANGLIVNEVA